MRAALLGFILGTSAVLPAKPVGAMPTLPTTSASAPPVVRVEFWCSPGFEPRGGGCVATLSRDEVFIYDQEDDVAPRRHRHHRRGLRELY